MQKNNYFLWCSIIFLAVFILHALRSILGWEAVIGGWQVPMWVSWVALVVAGLLSYQGFMLGGYLKK